MSFYDISNKQVVCTKFYAYYTHLNYEDSISGKFADVVVDFGDKGKFIFSRETSYLPFWKSNSNKISFREIVRRNGDEIKPDKYNLYSFVNII